jgi:septal ring factor EnvC (AmiA/AmiB activator)
MLVSDEATSVHAVQQNMPLCACHKLGCHLLCLAVLPQVAPKRAALAAAQESLDKTLAELASAQARLLAVQEKIAALEAQFEEATAKKASLAAQVRPRISDLAGNVH